jgi:hypothetical protein
MRRLILALLILQALPAASVRAQTNDVTAESRYLFVFETSSAMKRRAENLQRTVGDLIFTGMSDQLREGDTIGVWTFNSTLSAGNLPLIRWVPARRMNTANSVTDFLRKQKYENNAQPGVVIPAINRLITNSPRFTVVLFTAGGDISGTPYDVEINAAYAPFRETQMRDRMPFVTVLRAKDGKHLGFAVTPAPWAVEFPKFPPEPVVVVPAKSEVKPPPPRPAPAPLIVIGNKATNALPEVPLPAVTLPQPGTETLRPETGKPEPTAAEKLFEQIAAERGLAVPKSDTPQPAKPVEPPVESPKPAPVPVETPKLQTPIAPPTEVPVPQKAEVESESPPQAKAVAVIKEARTNAIAAEIQAVMLPPSTGLNRGLLFAIGAGGVLLGAGSIFLLTRNRQRSHVSLITSSMDKQRK